MRLHPRNFVAAGVVVLVGVAAGYSGFRSSEPDHYSAGEVHEAFAKHGFEPEVMKVEPGGLTTFELLKLFSGDDLEGVEDLVTGNAGLEVWVFENDGRAKQMFEGCRTLPESRTCVRRSNVLAIVPSDRAKAGRAAVQDLG